MTLDVSLSARVEEWRRLANERPFTAEEYRQVLAELRSGRVAAAKASAKSRAAKTPIDVTTLMDEIDNI